MAVQCLLGRRRGEEEEVAFRDVDECVEDEGFGAVEAAGAKGVDDEGAEEGAVEVVGLGGHIDYWRGGDVIV